MGLKKITSAVRGKSAAPSAKEMLKETHTSTDQRDASDIDGDTFGSDSEASIPDSEASIPDSEASIPDSEASIPENDDPSTKSHASLENRSKRSETENVASNVDTPEQSDLKIETFPVFLDAEPHGKLLAACICNNHLLVEKAINALDIKNTAREEVTELFEKLVFNSALLKHLDTLEVLLVYMKDHLINSDEFINNFIDELETADSTTNERLQIVNILLGTKFPIGCNPKSKRSALELLILGLG